MPTCFSIILFKNTAIHKKLACELLTYFGSIFSPLGFSRRVKVETSQKKTDAH